MYLHNNYINVIYNVTIYNSYCKYIICGYRNYIKRLSDSRSKTT